MSKLILSVTENATVLLKDMKEIFKQLAVIWNEMKGLHRGASLTILLAVVATLCFVLLKSSTAHLVTLFPGKTFSASEMETIEAYLMDAEVPYRIDAEKGMLVASGRAAEVRSGLGGLQKGGEAKGFELFDTNTWIKGEKELQVLEMRALKGQLEKDLAAFENIKSASVILDIPPQKSFNASKFQTKASVILTLMPKEHLSASQLRAITNHLAGAVRGLEPHMIAISDTTGKLYKAIDPQGSDDSLHDTSLLFEEHVQAKVSALLVRLVGEEHFYTSVQAVLEKSTEKVVSLSIAAVIDADIAEAHGPSFRQEIERQLTSVAKGYGIDEEATVDFIPLNHKRSTRIEEKPGGNKLGLIFTFVFAATVLVALIPLLRKVKKEKRGEEEVLFKLMTRVDLKKLAESIGSEDPQTIALMLSYLEPERAEQMIASLKAELQEEVLYHLSELEKRETS